VFTGFSGSGEGRGGDVAVDGDAEVDVLGAAGFGEVGLGELVVGGVEADAESFGFAGPAFSFGFSDAGVEVVADFFKAGRFLGCRVPDRALPGLPRFLPVNAGLQPPSDSQIRGRLARVINRGHLAGVTATSGGAQVASYVYGSDGSLFAQTEGARTTVYLPGEQMTIDTSTSPATLSGVRFYSLPGGITAVRTGLGSSYGFELQSDNHGTSTLWLDSTAQVPAWPVNR